MIQTLTESIAHVARAQYFLMNHTQNWGECGIDAVLAGYAQLHFKLPVSEVVDFPTMQRMIRDFETDTSLASRSPEKWKAICDNPEVVLNGRRFNLARDTEAVNDMLAESGEECRVITGMVGTHRLIVFGRGRELQLGGVSAFIMEKEYARTPIANLAAVGFGMNYAMMRQECVEYIFHHKWKSELGYVHADPEDLYSSLNRLMLASGYNITSLQELNACKNECIDDMADFILRHEIGHIQYFKQERHPVQAGQEQGLSYLGDNIVTALHEPLADWSPGMGGQLGPMRQIIQYGRNGQPDRARRMLFTYLSDNCFTDEEDNLSLQSQVDFAIVLSFINDAGEIDYEKMEQSTNLIHTLMSTTCRDTTARIKHIIQNAEYYIGENRYGYDFVEVQSKKFLTQDDCDISNIDSTPYHNAAMNNELLLLRRFSGENFVLVEETMSGSEKHFKQELLHLLDPEAATRFHGDLNAYAYDRLSRLIDMDYL